MELVSYFLSLPVGYAFYCQAVCVFWIAVSVMSYENVMYQRLSCHLANKLTWDMLVFTLLAPLLYCFSILLPCKMFCDRQIIIQSYSTCRERLVSYIHSTVSVISHEKVWYQRNIVFQYMSCDV